MKYRSVLSAVALALSLAACGGGSSVPASSTSSSAAQTVSTSGQSAGTAFPVTLSAAVASAAGVTASSFTLPFTIPSNTTVTANSAQPSQITTPFSIEGPVPLGARRGLSESVPGAVARLFFVISPPSTISLSGNYSFQFTLQNAPISGLNYYIAVYDGSQWHGNANGSPATVSGNTLSFSGSFPSGISLSANTAYGVALYTLPLTTSASVTTTTGAQAVTVNGLIDGGVTLVLPAANAAVSLQYVSSETAPSGAPNLLASSGVNNVPGYITVTPSSSVTFLSGQTIALSHLHDSGGNQSGSSGASGTTSGTAAGTTNGTTNGTTSGTPTGNNNSNNGNGSNNNNGDTPVFLAVYDSSRPALGWVKGFGTYSTDGVFDHLNYTLPADETLQANVTYYFAVYQ